MRYNKLIRDKIPELLDQKGINYKTHIAEDEEYWLKLKEKLLEEVTEFNDSENIEELADIFEVIEAIISYKKFNHVSIESTRNSKAEERGRFNKRIILEES